MLDRIKKMAMAREEAFMSHVSDRVKERLERPDPITWEEYEGVRANSYERKLLQQKLTDDALVKLISYCYGQSSFRKLYRFDLPAHYDEAITDELLPMLLERLEKK